MPRGLFNSCYSRLPEMARASLESEQVSEKRYRHVLGCCEYGGRMTRRNNRGPPLPNVVVLRAVPDHAKTVVCILKDRRKAGPGRTAADLHMMPPGTSSGGASLAAGRPLRVAGGRLRVVVALIPVSTPFVDVLSKVKNAERVRLVLADCEGAANLPAPAPHVGGT